MFQAMQVEQTLEPVYLEFVTAICVISDSLVDREKLYIKFTGDHPDRQMAGVVDASGNIQELLKYRIPLLLRTWRAILEEVNNYQHI